MIDEFWKHNKWFFFVTNDTPVCKVYWVKFIRVMLMSIFGEIVNKTF